MKHKGREKGVGGSCETQGEGERDGGVQVKHKGREKGRGEAHVKHKGREKGTGGFK